MFWWLSSLAFKQTLSQRLVLSQGLRSQSVAVVSGIPAATPPYCFARTPDGWVQMFNGLSRPRKWNGYRFESVTVGVDAPVNAPALTGSGSGSMSGTYTVYQRFLDEEGNPSNPSPVSNELTVSGAARLTVSGLDTPADSKVARRQILRNTDGQALTYYVEVDSTDLAVTSFTLTLTDAALEAQTAVPFFDSEGNSLANIYGIPPNHKPLVCAYLGRMFAAGEAPYGEGNCQVTAGSTTVTGIGTVWTTALVGRLLYALGEPTAYEITAVDEAAQTLTIDPAFAGATDLFKTYTIRAQPAERNNIYYSEAGAYDAWPASNALSLEDNGDTVTALLAQDSFLFIIQRRHIYRLSYLQNPGVDGGVFPSGRRGCINHRCAVQIDMFAYCLDEEGIYRFTTGGMIEPLSIPIQDLFWLDRPEGELRVNWEAGDFFHAVLHKEETTIRWFVALSGSRQPRHAICYNYRNNVWWLEEYPWPVGASCVTETSVPRPFLAGPGGRIFALGVDNLDVTKASDGTTLNTVSSATPTTLTDLYALVPASGTDLTPIAIVDGRGKAQRRLVSSVSGQVYLTDQPWLVTPDSTSLYQLGAISWLWRGGWYRWADEEASNPRRVEILFGPTAADQQCDLRLYKDHADTPTVCQSSWPPTTAESVGVSFQEGSPDIVVDFTFDAGFAQQRMDGHKAQYVNRPDVVSLELRGFSGPEPVQIYEITLEGAS